MVDMERGDGVKRGRGAVGQAGVQVPLLPEPATGAGAGTDVRVRAEGRQRGPCAADSGLVPGAAQSFVRGHLGAADGVEERPGPRLPAAGVLRPVAAGTAAPADRLCGVLGVKGPPPQFTSKRKSRACAEYSRSGVRFTGGQLSLAKMSDPVDIVWSRPLPEGAEPSTGTHRQRALAWMRQARGVRPRRGRDLQGRYLLFW